MLILILIGLAGLAVCCLTVRHWIRRYGPGPLLWRWLSGHALDGQHRTNATWTKHSHGNRAVLHPTGHAVRLASPAEPAPGRYPLRVDAGGPGGRLRAAPRPG